MAGNPAQQRIWGWMMFDWASQPYNTLLLTFTFGPYFAETLSARLIREGYDVASSNAMAQAYWAWGIALTGLIIAILAPVLGAIADSAGRRMPYIVVFSMLYVFGAGSLWWSMPNANYPFVMLAAFGIGLIGMECATAFTNSLLPNLVGRSQVGLISGKGFSLGYAGGLVALIIVILFLAENSAGRTFLGNPPAFGLDPDLREGTRSVGPLTALWYMVFMVPFFVWVREPAVTRISSLKVALTSGFKDLKKTIKKLPRSPSFASFLAASMLYRDALNGMYTFGGIYAFGVLGWTVQDIGIFGILAVISGMLFSFIGGYADRRFGPKLVILVSILALLAAAIGIVSISREAVFGFPVDPQTLVPDIAFYICGVLVGAAGGTIQSASRTMLVLQGNPDRMTEAFGLYAMAGKATAFLAPAMIAVVTMASDSQRIGVSPVIALFLLGLILLIWVKANGEDKAVWDTAT